jgi:hypothetical protein
LTNYKKKAKRIVKFLRLTDERGLLSLTNVTMIIVIYKLAITPSMNFSDITALALGVLGYQFKRVVEK